MPALEYTITEVKLPSLYDFCKNSLLNDRKDEVVDEKVVSDHYEQVDASPWRANEAYRLYRSKWQSLQTDYHVIRSNGHVA